MIHFKSGSHAYNIIDLLSVTGEFPLSSLEILGSRQTYENAIRRMLIPQKIVDGQEDIICKLLTVSGQNGRRKIRLTKEALPLLKLLGAEKYYYENYMRSHRSSSSEHTIRNARFAESVAMFRSAGYEFRPHKLPVLQVEKRMQIIGSAPVFYPAKLIKTFDNIDVKKTGFTRMTGALLAQQRAYVVYNTCNELMKGFDGGGEIKAWYSVGSIVAFNADLGYDAYADGIHWFSFLNGDICGLHHFKERTVENPNQWGVICFPHQLGLIWEYLGKKINVSTVTLNDLDKAISY